MKITPAYLREQSLLHATANYGTAGEKYAPLISQIVNKLRITEMLDYGSGRGNLIPHLAFDHQVKVQLYDPAIPEYAGEAVPMQFCVCTEVLEHVEPECLAAVLSDLQRCTGLVGFFSISVRPAEKTLSDGRNAHLIQKPPEWWWDKLKDRFEINTFQRLGDEACYFIVYALPDPVVILPGNDTVN